MSRMNHAESATWCLSATVVDHFLVRTPHQLLVSSAALNRVLVENAISKCTSQIQLLPHVTCDMSKTKACIDSGIVPMRQ